MGTRVKKKVVLTEAQNDALMRQIPPLSDGGVAELSDYNGTGALHSRHSLRMDEVGIKPETIEGVWFTVAVVRAMANGKLKFGFDDAGLAKAAKALVAQIDKVADLYDS